MAADGAIFDVALPRAGGQVDRDYDLFAAGVADVGGFVLHSVVEKGDGSLSRKKTPVPFFLAQRRLHGSAGFFQAGAGDEEGVLVPVLAIE